MNRRTPSPLRLAAFTLAAGLAGAGALPGGARDLLPRASAQELAAPASDAPGGNRGKDPGRGGHADVFGVRMLHRTRVGGEEWYLKENLTGDDRFNSQAKAGELVRNPDGSWKLTADRARMLVYTSTSRRSKSPVELDRDLLAARGYMQDPNDWKNVEITGYVKLNNTSDAADNFTWYARGGRHRDNLNGCEGSAYKGDLHFDGNSRIGKETWHVSYDYTDYQKSVAPLLGRWVGFKTVIRNVTENGVTAVKVDVYVDEEGDGSSWRKLAKLVDDGTFGGDADHCGTPGVTPPAMPITWGGPIATFRWDSTTDVDFKWLSVREIDEGD